MPAAGEAPEGLEGSASRRASQPFQVSHGVPGPVLKQGRETTLQCRLGHMPLEIRIVLRQRCVLSISIICVNYFSNFRQRPALAAVLD
jgi:hypothetical protein